MPFTMEGTTLEAAGTSNGFCVASLVLGIIGIPAFCTVIPPVLAIIFGIIGYNQVSKSGAEGGGKGMAIAGIICGVIGCLMNETEKDRERRECQPGPDEDGQCHFEMALLDEGHEEHRVPIQGPQRHPPRIP